MDNYFSSREILEKAIGTDAYFQIKSILFGLKAADVAEVRHGRWEDKTNISRAEVEQRVDCSVCGQIFWTTAVLSFNYCPNCGALMKEDEHEAG